MVVASLGNHFCVNKSKSMSDQVACFTSQLFLLSCIPITDATLDSTNNLHVTYLSTSAIKFGHDGSPTPLVTWAQYLASTLPAV